MRRELALLLVGAGTVLVSLYMPWEQATEQTGYSNGNSGSVAGQLSLFSGEISIGSWSSGIGVAAALLALALGAGAVAALARPNLAAGLPLGTSSALVVYFTIAVALEARSVARLRELQLKEALEFHAAYGAFVGAAGAVAVAIAAVAIRRGDLTTPRRAGVVFAVLGGALALACLLPWWRYDRVTTLGIAIPSAQLAAALGVTTAGWSWLRKSETLNLSALFAAGAAIFSVAAFSTTSFGAERSYGAWLGLACALGLVVLALSRSPRPRRRDIPLSALALASAAAVLVVALFLPWQNACYEKSRDFDEFSGRCVSSNGWTTSGSAAGLLALTLVVCALVSTRVRFSVLEMAAGMAILVATLGFSLEDRSSDGVTLEPGYGSWIGYAAAGAVVVLALLHTARRRIDRSRILPRLVPLSLCAAYLLLSVLPWWDVLPQGWRSPLFLAEPSWLAITGVLLAIALVGAWLRELPGRSRRVVWLTLLPLGMLTLLPVELVRFDTLPVSWGDRARWGDAVVLGLCLALGYLGRVEEQGGLEHARVPEILRVDRL